MAEAKQERRRRELKQREADLRRATEQHEARKLFAHAEYHYRNGDPLAASRQLQKILHRVPDHPAALGLLGEIHFKAGQDADALYYWNLLRKEPDHTPPGVFYFCGIA